MSNAIRYDTLLTRDLAAELHARLRGARVDAILFDRTLLRVALLVRAPGRRAERPPSLLWQLHPQSGHLTGIDPATAAGSPVPLRPGSAIAAITAPADERMIELQLDAGPAAAGATRRLVIELVANQWNAVALGADDRIVAVLRERTTHGRVLQPGVTYARPAPSMRAWATERPAAGEWAAALRAQPPGHRLGALMRHAAYSSPLNAATIVGNADVADDDDTLERARARYLAIVHDAPREPVLLAALEHAQPYSVRLADDDASLPTLLAAFEEAARHAALLPAAPAAADAALEALEQRVAQLEQRARRLRGEQTGAEEEARHLRQCADLLLSQPFRVPRGAARAELDDFHGGTVVVELDPAVGAAENATRLYDAARKRARAAARIPALLRAAGRELAQLRELAARIRDGTAETAEIERLARAGTRARRTRDQPRILPYREYRTSSGLEVRVGRGARANDALTFRHASPTDVWLHARDVAGAHVILRWARADQNPAARDIAEAAVLAALHSRARTSRVVAVDWTRRKYVRKPRKSAPGVVVPERVRTVFVEPDRTVEERLRTTEP